MLGSMKNYDPEHVVIIAGTRTFNDFIFAEKKLNSIFQNIDPRKMLIVSGGAEGADYLGECYARKYEIDFLVLPAWWSKLGKKAGYVRNKRMAELATNCIVFWDGVSRGSKNMIELATLKQIPLRIIRYDKQFQKTRKVP